MEIKKQTKLENEHVIKKAQQLKEIDELKSQLSKKDEEYKTLDTLIRELKISNENLQVFKIREMETEIDV